MPADDIDPDDRPRPRRRRFEDEDDYEDRPRRRASSSGSPLLLIFGVIAGVLVVGCGGVIALGVVATRQARQAMEEARAEMDRARAAEQARAAPFGNPGGVGLREARAGFRSQLTNRAGPKTPPPRPPAGGPLALVKYDAPNGPTPAYLTPDPKDGRKRPGIVWITGGDCNSIDDGVFEPGPPANDQSAAAFRLAGVAMLYPSLRGGNDSPGRKEGFLGEVDDVIAAGKFLAAQPHVDPDRVYLGGHSTGGTLALLVAESTDRFRAVFSFGPADDVAGYGPEFLPFDFRTPKEVELRSPGKWLHAVQVPTFVFEGTIDGNLDSLQTMAAANRNPKAKFFPVRGKNHFDLLAPLNQHLAAKVLADTGPACDLALTEAEVNRAAGGR